MDVARRLSLTAGVTAIAVAAYNPVALALVNRADPTTDRLAEPVVILLTAITMLGGVWFILRPRIEARWPALQRHALLVDTTALLFFLGLITEQVSTTQTTRHSMWLYYAFVIVFAASYLPRIFTPVFGLLSSACVLLSSAISGNLGRGSAGDVLIVCLGLPILSVFMMTLAHAVEHLRLESERARAELVAQVDALSEALAVVGPAPLGPPGTSQIRRHSGKHQRGGGRRVCDLAPYSSGEIFAHSCAERTPGVERHADALGPRHCALRARRHRGSTGRRSRHGVRLAIRESGRDQRRHGDRMWSRDIGGIQTPWAAGDLFMC